MEPSENLDESLIHLQRWWIFSNAVIVFPFFQYIPYFVVHLHACGNFFMVVYHLGSLKHLKELEIFILFVHNDLAWKF